ncbi:MULTISPECIES: CDF family Co(II)/Ni(II) efflux transporter DmeF [unclassified Synechocystis]|uniref:CDF family Co(II)/Ni(II) efflux transporter DmeF n=1 Tax=unclassified Synechocystis TaxID=2640012 RepID=UPI0003FA8BB4|nr:MULTISPECIES: CDF family Co(II)/Ni(II) efflux transporter DmeF [unclassified Synechocystis]AIE73881.1 Cobalt-zinc-cadmium resistance protein CzcD [Synechocystis sp. PCC 6714]MCT0252459.1 CDF family Co(II)/Ni(II) efflux transporter DmeF [Synechocystis sp. CS-94]
MHFHTPESWQHSHDFANQHQSHAEKNTKIVMVLTAVTMVAEIIAGTVFGSMALLADGWHMATHVAAFGITLFAYQYARRYATSPRYTYGTGKVSVLGGFASAVALGVIAFLMAFESIGRFFSPHSIQFSEAIAVAILGLLVNLVSAWLLQDRDDHHHHGHHHEHHDDHHHHRHQDHNLRAAYFHVLADALTSVLAIVALVAGKFWGWVWLDAAMGLVGAAVIIKWAYGLVNDTSAILLDGSVDKKIQLEILTALEANTDTRVMDLHVWYLNENYLAGTIALVTHFPQSPEYYKQQLSHISSLAHVIVEVNPCSGESCSAESSTVGVIASGPIAP